MCNVTVCELEQQRFSLMSRLMRFVTDTVPGASAVWRHVLLPFLCVQDLCRWSQLCRQCRCDAHAHRDWIWHRLLERDFEAIERPFHCLAMERYLRSQQWQRTPDHIVLFLRSVFLQRAHGDTRAAKQHALRCIQSMPGWERTSPYWTVNPECRQERWRPDWRNPLHFGASPRHRGSVSESVGLKTLVRLPTVYGPPLSCSVDWVLSDRLCASQTEYILRYMNTTSASVPHLASPTRPACPAVQTGVPRLSSWQHLRWTHWVWFRYVTIPAVWRLTEWLSTVMTLVLVGIKLGTCASFPSWIAIVSPAVLSRASSALYATANALWNTERDCRYTVCKQSFHSVRSPRHPWSATTDLLSWMCQIWLWAGTACVLEGRLTLGCFMWVAFGCLCTCMLFDGWGWAVARVPRDLASMSWLGAHLGSLFGLLEICWLYVGIRYDWCWRACLVPFSVCAHLFLMASMADVVVPLGRDGRRAHAFGLLLLHLVLVCAPLAHPLVVLLLLFAYIHDAACLAHVIQSSVPAARWQLHLCTLLAWQMHSVMILWLEDDSVAALCVGVFSAAVLQGCETYQRQRIVDRDALDVVTRRIRFGDVPHVFSNLALTARELRDVMQALHAWCSHNG